VNIDSEAHKDLDLSPEDASGVSGGHETTKKAAKHHAKAAKAGHAASAAAGPVMIVQPAVYGTPTVSANSGDDDCAPESGGDPGGQDGST
jgi:hypothetical protein